MENVIKRMHSSRMRPDRVSGLLWGVGVYLPVHTPSACWDTHPQPKCMFGYTPPPLPPWTDKHESVNISPLMITCHSRHRKTKCSHMMFRGKPWKHFLNNQTFLNQTGKFFVGFSSLATNSILSIAISIRTQICNNLVFFRKWWIRRIAQNYPSTDNILA